MRYDGLANLFPQKLCDLSPAHPASAFDSSFHAAGARRYILVDSGVRPLLFGRAPRFQQLLHLSSGASAYELR